MKKVFLTFAFVAAAFFCQAQLFVGGSLGFGVGSGKDKVEGVEIDKPKTLAFSINPNVGYMFNDRMGVGVDFGYGMNRTKYDDALNTKEFTHSWTASPYFRYVFVDWNPIKFYGDLQVNFAGTKDKIKNDDDTNDGVKSFTVGANFVPGMAYSLTDNLSINAQVYLLAIGYNMTKNSAAVNPDDNYIKTNSFGFNINKATPLTIGFFYTF